MTPFDDVTNALLALLVWFCCRYVAALVWSAERKSEPPDKGK